MKIAIIALLVLAIAVPAGLYFTHTGPFAPAEGEEGETAAAAHDPHAVPNYLTLDPPFVVNFMHRGTLRYLQLSLDLMFYEAEMLEQVKTRMPAVRNDLILLLSRQEFESLSTPEGKEHLRDEIMLAVNHVLEIEPPAEGETAEEIGDVYITNFVMQ